MVSPYGYPGLLLSDAARMAPAVRPGGDAPVERNSPRHGSVFRVLPHASAAQRRLVRALSGGVLHPGRCDGGHGFDRGRLRELWKGIREGHQWTIKKCKRLGFVPRMVSLREHIERVMEIYWLTMDRVQAKESYYFGREYFARLGEMPGQVHCCVVESERSAGGGVYLLRMRRNRPGTPGRYQVGVPEQISVSPAPLFLRRDGPSPEAIVTCTSGGGVGGLNDRLLQFKRGFSQAALSFFDPASHHR